MWLNQGMKQFEADLNLQEYCAQKRSDPTVVLATWSDVKRILGVLLWPKEPSYLFYYFGDLRTIPLYKGQHLQKISFGWPSVFAFCQFSGKALGWQGIAWCTATRTSSWFVSFDQGLVLSDCLQKRVETKLAKKKQSTLSGPVFWVFLCFSQERADISLQHVWWASVLTAVSQVMMAVALSGAAWQGPK